MLKEINAKNKSVLLIGDYHAPYHHRDYLEFCKAVSKKIKADIVINMGDWEDQHAISFHDSDCSLPSASQELELVIDHAQIWYKNFPNMIILDSNHGSLVFRRMKHHGIPLAHIRPLKEVYDTPNWKWFEHILLSTLQGPTYLCHGKASPFNKLAKETGYNCWQGHFHTRHEVTWISAVNNERYNAFTGCGVNRDSQALAYGKNNIPQPILGCGAIDKNGMPLLFKMNVNKRNRWDKKL